MSFFKHQKVPANFIYWAFDSKLIQLLKIISNVLTIISKGFEVSLQQPLPFCWLPGGLDFFRQVELSLYKEFRSFLFLTILSSKLFGFFPVLILLLSLLVKHWWGRSRKTHYSITALRNFNAPDQITIMPEKILPMDP